MLFRKEFLNDIYGAEIMLVIGPLEEFKAWMLETYPEADFSAVQWRGASGRTIRHEDEDGSEIYDWFVWLPVWSGRRGDVLTLAHECNHLAIQILRNVGVKLVEESEEAYTYLSGGLMRALWKELDLYVERQKHRGNTRKTARTRGRTPGRTARKKQSR